MATETELVERVTKRVLEELKKRERKEDFAPSGYGGGGAPGYSVYNFLCLNDTPSDYTGQAGRYVLVNVTEDGLVFDTVAGAGETLFIPAFADSNIIQGSWAISGGGVAQWCGYVNNAPANDLDEIHFPCWLQKGTYDIIFLFIRNNRSGIVEVRLNDGVSDQLLDTIDLYNGTLTYNYPHKTSSKVVATSGPKTVKFKINGKNALSIDYYLTLSGVYFTRVS